MHLILLVVFVIGVAGCGLFLIRHVQNHQGDPYVTLSDRKSRLEALRKKD